MDTPEIDPKLRKPRQLRGTPANRFSAYLSLGVLGFGCLLGLVYHNVPYYNTFIKDLASGKIFAQSEEQRRQNELMRAHFELQTITTRSYKDLKENYENAKQSTEFPTIN